MGFMADYDWIPRDFCWVFWVVAILHKITKLRRAAWTFGDCYNQDRWFEKKKNHPETWGNDSQFDEHIFQMGWNVGSTTNQYCLWNTLVGKLIKFTLRKSNLAINIFLQPLGNTSNKWWVTGGRPLWLDGPHPGLVGRRHGTLVLVGRPKIWRFGVSETKGATVCCAGMKVEVHFGGDSGVFFELVVWWDFQKSNL